MKPVKPALWGYICSEGFDFHAEIFWLNSAVAGCMLDFGLCAQARVTPVVLRDTKEMRPTFSENQCILQVLVTGSGGVDCEELWDSRIPGCLPELSRWIFTCCFHLQNRTASLYCKCDAETQTRAGALSLSAFHPGSVPWGALAGWWDGKVC